MQGGDRLDSLHIQIQTISGATMSALSIRFAAAMFVSVAFASVASAGLLVFDNLQGQNLATSNPNPYNGTVNILGSNISLAGTGIGYGSGLAGKAGNSHRYVVNNWTGSSSLGDAVNNDKYLTVKITADAGYQIKAERFVFAGQRGGSTAADGSMIDNGPTSFAVQSSADGFGATNPNLANPSYANINSPEPTDITLSGTQFENLTSIEFRIYGWDAGIANGGYSVNDYEFFGTVSAVPEPTSLILVGLACAPMLLRRRSLVA